MKAADKKAKLESLQKEAQELQARLGFLTLQKENAEKEMGRIRTILEYQEAQYTALAQAPVEAETAE